MKMLSIANGIDAISTGPASVERDSHCDADGVILVLGKIHQSVLWPFDRK